MTDFHAGLDSRPTESDTERHDRGLLASDRARRGATFARRPGEESGPTRLYRAVPVRVDGVSAALLVGPWHELSAAQSYRIEAVETAPAGELATVRFRATDGDAE